MMRFWKWFWGTRGTEPGKIEVMARKDGETLSTVCNIDDSMVIYKKRYGSLQYCYVLLRKDYVRYPFINNETRLIKQLIQSEKEISFCQVDDSMNFLGIFYKFLVKFFQNKH